MTWAALAGGLAAGVLLFALQSVWVTPLIHRAEAYEPGAGGAGTTVSAPAQGGNAPGWMPAEGLQRTGLTLVADLLAGVGFGLLLAAGMTLRRDPPAGAAGLLWGLGGYAAFVLAPALGLPPELPAAPVAMLGPRQLWWGGTVLATALGLAVLAFAPRWTGVLGLVLLAAPHAVGAPPPLLATPDPLPASLAAHYVAGVLVTTAVFWATLGPVCAWMLRRLS